MRKCNFFTGQPIFTQLLGLIPRHIISGQSQKYSADRYCKSFKAYDHLVTMLYQGFFQCVSLRELITGLQANQSRLLHLGLVHTPRRSTLSDANSRRSADFFASLYHRLYEHFYGSLPDSRSLLKKLFIIDSTTISLFSDIMKGAGMAKGNGKKKGGIKAHMIIDAEHNLPCFTLLTEARHHDLVFLQKVQLPPDSVVVFDRAYTNYKQFEEWNKQGITWVTRQKNDSSFKILSEQPVSAGSSGQGVIADQRLLAGRYSNRNKIPLIEFRRVIFKDPVSQKQFAFITNETKLDPEQIALLYKKRWQIELLFKRIKQRYPLRYFLGETVNAIQIQIWCMLICDLLVQIVLSGVNKAGKRQWAYANLAAMIKHHLMTYIKLIPFLLNPEKTLLNYKPPDQTVNMLF